MSDISVRGLITKNVAEITDLVNMFIKSSLNIREGIIREPDPATCMLSLIRDTYVCNLLLRYVGMMTLISGDQKWEIIDNKIMTYTQDYFNNDRFKNKLTTLYEHYLKTYDETKKNYDYCKFLDKMISKAEISKKGIEIKKVIRMIENRVFNILNVTPTIKIGIRHFKTIPQHYEIKQEKVIVPLTQTNYHDMLELIDNSMIRHEIEKQYMSRTKNALVDFSKLIVSRKILAEQSGFKTFFKYINRGKFDNSDTIKELIVQLNQKIDARTQLEISKIHQYYLHRDNDVEKISLCDIIKYCRIHKNNTKFDPRHVFYVIFYLLEKYFNVRMEKTSEKTWRNNVIMYNMLDTLTSKLLGRLFMDIMYDPDKKDASPISIRLSDKMQINPDNQSMAEIALIANYRQNSKSMSYHDIVLLFKEFGYILSGTCYESRVGLINYDEEFSNFLPLLMEYIAWDRDTIAMIVGNQDITIGDHIGLGRNIDLCFNIKLKCIDAKFDHLLHNSEPLMELIVKAMETKGEAGDVIVETYRDIYQEIMGPLETILTINGNMAQIDPHTIIQEINNSQGMLYANMMNEIFAYTSYWIIKKNVNNGEFRQCILNNGVDNYRDLVRNFLKKHDINCFTLFIKNVIGWDCVAEDCVTEDINYFDDNEHDSESDKEEIIQIDRSNQIPLSPRQG
jgi:hypothetical protein